MPTAYLVLAAVIAGSAVFPPLPSESALAVAMGLALAGDLRLAPTALAATAGAVAGDLLAYGVGRAVAGRAQQGLASSPRGRAALAWVRRRGPRWLPVLVVVGRWVPGGTTGVGIGCGVLRYPVRRFAPLALLGAVLWTGYGLGVATVGRRAFPDAPWLAVGLGLATALGVGVVVQAVARARRRRGRTPGPDEER